MTTMADLASYSASGTFFEDMITITGDVDEIAPDAFCIGCDQLLDRDEHVKCRACNAINSDRDKLDRNDV